MSTLNKVANKRETLNIRIKPEERSLIDHAARMRGGIALISFWTQRVWLSRRLMGERLSHPACER